MKNINKIVKETFNKVLKEYMDDDPWYDGYNGMTADDARYDEMMDTMPPSEEMYNQEMPMQQEPMDGQMANGMKRPHKVNLDGTLNENKDMKKKQIVRLTESDLHKVIKESVTKILTELDWKTYANAARKRAQQGASASDIDALDSAANKALKNKYGVDMGWTKYGAQVHTHGNDYDGHYQSGNYPDLGYMGDFNDTYSRPLDDEFDENDPNAWQSTSYDNSPIHKDRHEDMSKYFKGKSKYENGKWQ